MRKDEKERKKILVPNSVHTRPGRENSKKNSKKFKKFKSLFQHYVYRKWVERGREREEKILVLNSGHTPPWKENCEKNSKKNQKIKKPLYSLFYSQNRMR